MNGRDIAGAANDRIVRRSGVGTVSDQCNVSMSGTSRTSAAPLIIQVQYPPRWTVQSPRGGCWAVARETDPLMMPQGVVPEGSEGWWSVDLLLAGQHCTLPCMRRVANVQRRA